MSIMAPRPNDVPLGLTEKIGLILIILLSSEVKYSTRA